LNHQVLIVHGEIASGKTRRGEQISDRAKVNGYRVHGILCQRVMRDRETIGYDMVDLESRKTRPMVYSEIEVQGEEWKPLRGPFLYNEETFKEANRLLTEAAYGMDAKTLVVIDEYGHLEARGFGVYPGLRMVTESVWSGGKLLVLCRTEKIDDVIRVFAQNEVDILVMDAAQRDFMETLADSFI
jgi:nucleoside-triphosphatase THEP1